MFHLRKASSLHHGAKDRLWVSTLHTFGMNHAYIVNQQGSQAGGLAEQGSQEGGLAEQGAQAGGLAAQRLGSNPAPVKTCTSGAENHSISTKRGRGRRVQDLPASNSQTDVSLVPSCEISGRNPCAVPAFHLPPAPQH